MRLNNAIIVAVTVGFGLFASSASAYTVEAGNMLVRPVVGASINPLRLDVVTRATPPGGMLLGLDFDYSFDGAWNLTTALRPVASPGFLDVQAGAGVKYRVVQLEAPFIPYASAMLTGAVGGPFRIGAPHLNLGARLAMGIDYFVMRNLAIGIEAGVEGSALVMPLLAVEASTEALLGVSWRF